MSLAEKYFRKFYKVKDDLKLTNEQWKIVNMMHECLREHNKPKLPQGAILVNKKKLVDHLAFVKKYLNNVDELMRNPNYKEFASGTGGSKMAKISNAIQLTFHSILHFEMKVPLQRLNDDFEDLEVLQSDNNQSLSQKELFAIRFADWILYESVCFPEYKDKSIEELLEIYKKQK